VTGRLAEEAGSGWARDGSAQREEEDYAERRKRPGVRRVTRIKRSDIPVQRLQDGVSQREKSCAGGPAWRKGNGLAVDHLQTSLRKMKNGANAAATVRRVEKNCTSCIPMRKSDLKKEGE